MSCCVPGCSVRFNDGVSLHRFPDPENDTERFRVWVLRVGGDIVGLSNDYIKKNRRVCHRHFEGKFHGMKGKLSKIAIPTLLLTGSATRPIRINEDMPMVENRPPPIQFDDVSIKPKQDQPCCSKSLGTSKSLQAPTRIDDVSIKPKQDQPCCSKSLGTSKSLQAPTRNTRIHANEVTMCNTIKKLKKIIRTHKNVAMSYKKRLILAKNALKVAEVNALEQLSIPARTFVEMQITQAKKLNRGRRFTLNQKILALSLFKSSPKAYRLLSQICLLPNRKTLQSLLQKMILNPGINKNMFHHLKEKVQKMPEHHKYCALLFDEMAIAPHLDMQGGNIMGFVDDGETRNPEISDHVLVFMVRGVIKKYKQPVHYSFCAGTTKSVVLKNLIKRIVTELQACGLKVIATVCDQGATNMAAINGLLNETKSKYLRKGKEYKEGFFKIGAKPIFALYDPPHLIKGIRNNLISKNLKFELRKKNCVAKWQHLIDLHMRSPGYRGVRLVPKLTDKHIIPTQIPKMRVKHCTQVFSRTVGVAMGFMADMGQLPECAKETADILMFFDDLFDSVNGSYSTPQGGKIYRCAVTPTSSHHKLWRDSIPVLKSMKFENKDGKASVVPSLSSWVKTIEGFKMLCKQMSKLGQNSLLLRNFNQDPLENFFGAIRAHGHSNIMPTAAGFQAAYKTLLINNISSTHSVGANCEKDTTKCLYDLKCLVEVTPSKENEKQKEQVINFEELNIDYNINEIISSKSPQHVEKCAAIGYCSGWLVRNARKHIYKNCTTCTSQLESVEKQAFHEYIKISEYCNKDWLCYPSREIFDIFLTIEITVIELLKSRSHEKEIFNLIKVIVSVNINTNFLTCPIHKNKLIDYFIDKNIIFCINNWCKEVNNILSGKRSNYDDNDRIKTAAQNHFNKNKLKKRNRATGVQVRV